MQKKNQINQNKKKILQQNQKNKQIKFLNLKMTYKQNKTQIKAQNNP